MVDIDDFKPREPPTYYTEIEFERQLFRRFAETDNLGIGDGIPRSDLKEAAGGYNPSDGDNYPERPWVWLALSDVLAKVLDRGYYDLGFTTDGGEVYYYTANTDYPIQLFTEFGPNDPHLRVLRTLTSADNGTGEPAFEAKSIGTLVVESGLDSRAEATEIVRDLEENGVVTFTDGNVRLASQRSAEAWAALKEYGPYFG